MKENVLVTILIVTLLCIVWAFTLESCAGAIPTSKTVSCIKRYQDCATTSQTMDQYVQCRNSVDVECWPNDAGTALGAP